VKFHDIGALLEAKVESKLMNFADFYISAVSVYSVTDNCTQYLLTSKFLLKITFDFYFFSRNYEL